MNKLQSDLSQLFYTVRYEREKIKKIFVGEQLYTYLKTFCRYNGTENKRDTFFGIPVERGVLFFENNYELIYKETL